MSCHTYSKIMILLSNNEIAFFTGLDDKLNMFNADLLKFFVEAKNVH